MPKSGHVRGRARDQVSPALPLSRKPPASAADPTCALRPRHRSCLAVREDIKTLKKQYDKVPPP